jgi:hypothetical protein
MSDSRLASLFFSQLIDLGFYLSRENQSYYASLRSAKLYESRLDSLFFSQLVGPGFYLREKPKVQPFKMHYCIYYTVQGWLTYFSLYLLIQDSIFERKTSYYASLRSAKLYESRLDSLFFSQLVGPGFYLREKTKATMLCQTS